MISLVSTLGLSDIKILRVFLLRVRQLDAKSQISILRFFGYIQFGKIDFVVRLMAFIVACFKLDQSKLFLLNVM